MDPRRYTLDEVARHDGNADPRFWIVIRGVVYDVTDFMSEHPGGVELIAERAGSDATSAFEDLGHSSDAKNRLKKYEIGSLAETESGKKKKDEELSNNFADADRIPTKRTNSRQRRKFLSLILGPYAST